MNEDQNNMVSNTAPATSLDHNQMKSTKSENTEEISWSSWLHENNSKLLLFARQQTRSLADAEDVLQDALIKLVKKEADGSFEGGQAAWLPYIYTSIRRCAIDLGRKEDRRSKREEKSEKDKIIQYGEFSDPWFNTSSADDEARKYLEQALKSLPEKFATVITLKIWGELTFAEIGNKLKISQNTAASRYRYGLEALKANLSSVKQIGDI